MKTKKHLTPYQRWVKGCLHKRHYHTIEQADAAILALERKGIYLSLYICSYCPYYHLTSKQRGNNP